MILYLYIIISTISNGIAFHCANHSHFYTLWSCSNTTITNGNNINIQEFNNVNNTLKNTSSLPLATLPEVTTSDPHCLPPEVQSNSSSTRRGTSPPDVSPAVSSSNYLSLKGRATPGDRGEGSDGMKYSTGPQVEPVADLREAEGELNKKATTASGRPRVESSLQDEVKMEHNPLSTTGVDFDDSVSLDNLPYDLISNDEVDGYQEGDKIMIPYIVDYPINMVESTDVDENREDIARDYLNSLSVFSNNSYDMILNNLSNGENIWDDLQTTTMCSEAVTKKRVKENMNFGTLSSIDIESLRKELVFGRARIHWFPRYFGRALGKLGDYIKSCDIILDVRDARMPYVSDDDFMLNVYNNMFTHKPKVIVFTHSDLSSYDGIIDWGRYYRIKEYRIYRLFNKNIKDELQWRPCTPIVFVDAKHGGKGIITLKKCIYSLCKRVQLKRIRMGLLPRPLRAIVLGLPNIGKSALINRLLGRYKTQSYNASGVTREIKWVRLHPDEYKEAIYKIIDIVDTPGILPPDLYKLCEYKYKNNKKKRNKILGRLYFNLNDTTIKGGYSKFGIDSKSQKLEKNIWLLAAANQIIEGAYELSEAAEILLQEIFTVYKLKIII